MERIIDYNEKDKELTVLFQPSFWESITGMCVKTINYVDIGETYFPTTDIRWINKDTGEDVRNKKFDYYVRVRKIQKTK